MGTGIRSQLDARLSELGELCDTGYALALHIRFTRPGMLFRTYPQDWIDHYSEMGMMLRDPVVLWGFHHTGSVLWKDLEDPDGILAEAARRGITNGLTCAVGPAGDRSISGFTRSSGPFSPAEIEKMHALTVTLHELSADLIPASA